MNRYTFPTEGTYFGHWLYFSKLSTSLPSKGPYEVPAIKMRILLYNLMNKLEVVLLSHFMQLADNRYLVAAALAAVVSVKVP